MLPWTPPSSLNLNINPSGPSPLSKYGLGVASGQINPGQQQQGQGQQGGGMQGIPGGVGGFSGPGGQATGLGLMTGGQGGGMGGDGYPGQQGQQQHQQQQQGLQQQGQQQQQGGQVAGQNGQNGQGQGGNGIGIGGPMNLASVLHYLQTEWRRYERDRNEWEIERAEMRARIALLEGERRGMDNLKTDLMRRVKMLEYALRQERSKYLSTGSGSGSAPPPPASGIPPSQKANILRSEGFGGTTSPEPSSPVVSEEPLPGGNANPNIIHPAAQGSGSIVAAAAAAGGGGGSSGGSQSGGSQAGGNTSRWSGQSGTWGGVGGRALDLRGKARSRDYLKQCLQEITYLTSAATLNPLPAQTSSGIPRPRKSLPENAPPPIAPYVMPSLPGSTASQNIPLPNGIPGQNIPPQLSRQGSGSDASSTGSNVGDKTNEGESRKEGDEQEGDRKSGSDESRGTGTDLLSSSNEESSSSSSGPNGIVPNGDIHQPSGSNNSLAETFAGSDLDEMMNSEGGNRVTAIFRPESSEAWKERLRRAGESLERKGSAKPVTPASSRKEDDELSQLNLQDDDESSGRSKDGSGEPGRKVWKPRKSLRSHLDSVRCLAFDRTDLTVASGGDDCTVKLWRLNAHNLSINSSRSSAPETEPQVTFRGHSATVTSVQISHQQERIYSSSLDATVQVWALPSRDRETYAPFDPNMKLATLVGHSDAIWDMALLPLRLKDESLLATASADGTVKVWTTDNLNSPLKLSWDYRGTEGPDGSDDEKSGRQLPGPTSVDVVHSDLRKLAVAYQDSVVKLFDVETGKQVLRLKSDETYDGTIGTQINKIAVHPTLPLLISAHEDRYIRFFDLNTGACTHSMLAHLDAVTSLDIDPSGLTLVSGGHDCSVRFWDLATTRNCIQEMTSHRPKSSEGVLDVKFHSTLPFLASAGADGLVKVYC